MKIDAKSKSSPESESQTLPESESHTLPESESQFQKYPNKNEIQYNAVPISHYKSC